MTRPRWGARKKIYEPQGQILESTQLGKWISVLAAEADVHSIVEIGTWKGLGSTLLIARSLAQTGKAAKFLSIEARKDFHDLAMRNLAQESSVELLWGTIVSKSDLDRENLEEHELPWLQEDETAIASAPNLASSMPDVVDLLVLDGGEFSTWAEFSFLLPRLTRYLVLDDTRVRKARKVERFLTSAGGWYRIGQGFDRNGWSVWVLAE